MNTQMGEGKAQDESAARRETDAPLVMTSSRQAGYNLGVRTQLAEVLMEATRGEYRISTDKTLLSLDAIHAFLSRSYWAPDRTREVIARSVENSLCYGLYHRGRQIGFARVISDGATLYHLCDVFVDEEYRGQGLGKWLVETVISDPALSGLKGHLATRDAQGLYRRYGFAPLEDAHNFMIRTPQK
jgi:GNAT superfamily N-acetyltransferase